MAKVESFDLDHTKVRAPYVRVAGKYETESGDPITKFDLRFSQPNVEFLPTKAIHSLEHLMAGYMRDELDGILDLSPMGCRTGLYLTLRGRPTPAKVLKSLEKVLNHVLAHTGPIPGASELECGNWKDHSLSAAKIWAKRVLDAGLKVQKTIPIPKGSSTQA